MQHLGKKEIIRITTITLDYVYLLCVSAWLVAAGQDFFIQIIEAVFYGARGEGYSRSILPALVFYGSFLLITYFLFKLNLKVFKKTTLSKPVVKNLGKKEIIRVGTITLNCIYLLSFIWLVVTGKDFFVDVFGTLFEGAVGEVSFREGLWGFSIIFIWIYLGYVLYKLNAKMFMAR